MAQDVDVQREVWQQTLSEIQRSSGSGETERHPCVICLDDVSEPAVAIPCRHDQFDFLCLASWLEERSLCPLCKADIKTVHYDIKSAADYKVYTVKQVGDHPATTRQRRPFLPRPPRRRRELERARPAGPEAVVQRRREVYRRSLYSLHVGSNRISRFRDLSPAMFARDAELVSRARKWIRRELKVFEYLNAPPADSASQGGFTRSNNAEFLLEYCVAILKTISLQDPSGRAEDMLQEFLGRGHAKLFLHELHSWLRSPYTSLEAWDSHVQYSESLDRLGAGAVGDRDSDRGDQTLTPRKRRRSDGESTNEEARSTLSCDIRGRGYRGYDSYRPQYDP